MMLEAIEQDIQEKVCAKIRLVSEGVSRFRVFTPFLFDDGDHLSIILKQEGGRWFLSDEGHTCMHLTYDRDERDLQRDIRQQDITNTLSLFQIEDRDGELLVPITESRYGDALLFFVQSLHNILTNHPMRTDESEADGCKMN